MIIYSFNVAKTVKISIRRLDVYTDIFTFCFNLTLEFYLSIWTVVMISPMSLLLKS